MSTRRTIDGIARSRSLVRAHELGLIGEVRHWRILPPCTAFRVRIFAQRRLARDLRAAVVVEIWKLRKDIGVVRASLADVLAQAEAARRAVDQLRWLLRDEEQAARAEHDVERALDRVNVSVGHLCESATHLQEAAKSTVAAVGGHGEKPGSADFHARQR